ncbi:hypothetical protein RP20_CCG018177 [Aedes albopictus]|nr:hypothetical protein RP20_CCG018177 [Aedes albopictus]
MFRVPCGTPGCRPIWARLPEERSTTEPTTTTITNTVSEKDNETEHMVCLVSITILVFVLTVLIITVSYVYMQRKKTNAQTKLIQVIIAAAQSAAVEKGEMQ